MSKQSEFDEDLSELEKWLKDRFWGRDYQVSMTTAAHLLKVAEEYVDDCSVKELQQAGGLTREGALMTQVRLDFIDYLKQYINQERGE